jgi:predicted phosphate transport protein (TIGR00153 family)
MLKMQDAVADRCEEVAYLFTMRKTRFPDFLKADFVVMIGKVKETVDCLTDVTRDLHSAYDESGSRSAAQSVLKSVDHIHQLEHDADIIEDSLRERLFDHEAEVDPITIMICLDIFRRSGNIADAAENVGDAIRMWIETR